MAGDPSQSHWTVSDIDWDASALQAGPAQRRRGAAEPVCCQVEGCSSDLTGLRPFYQRLRICELHAKAHSIIDASGHQLRFCQQCSKLEPIECFEADRRSCQTSLSKRRARRSGRSKYPGEPEGLGSEGAKGADSGDGAAGESLPVALGRSRRRTASQNQKLSGYVDDFDSEATSSDGESLSATSPRAADSQGGGRDARQQQKAPTAGAKRQRASSGGQPALPGLSPTLGSGNLAGGSWASGSGGIPPPRRRGSLEGPPLLSPADAGNVPWLPQLQPAAAAAGLPLFQQQQEQQPGASVAPALSAEEVEQLLSMDPESLADALLDIHSDSAGLGSQRALSGQLGQPAAPSQQQPSSSAPLSRATSGGPAHGPWPEPLPLLRPTSGGSAAATSAPLGSSTSAGMRGPASPPAALGAAPRTDAPTMGSAVLPLLPADPSLTPSLAVPTLAAGPVLAGLPAFAARPAGPTVSLSPAAAAAAPAARPEAAVPWQDEEIVNFSLKVFGARPEQLPAQLSTQLASALNLAPNVMRASVRPGCLCLTGCLLASREEAARLRGLQEGVAGALAGSLAGLLHACGAPSKVLSQVGSQLAAADGCKGAVAPLHLPDDCPALSLRLVSPAVIVAGAQSAGGSAVQAVLAGPGLASPAATLHCRSRGAHVVLTVLAARRGGDDSGPAAAADSTHTGGTADWQAWMLAAADGSSTDSYGGSTDSYGGSDSDSEFDDEELELRVPGGAPAGPAAYMPGAAPSECRLLLERLQLREGEDAVLVQLPALPAGQSWGLFELEVARGPLLSASVPLLVLPPWASDAALELACRLPLAAAAASWSAASLLQHLGFLLHTAEWQQGQHRRGATGLTLGPARRVHRLARGLAAFCAARGWNATAGLLLPLLATGTCGRACGGKCMPPGSAPVSSLVPGVAAADAAEATAAALLLPAREQEELQALLEGILAQRQQAWHDWPLACSSHQSGGGLRRSTAAQLADWFWTGCNLAAGAAGAVLLLRSVWA